MEHKQLQSHNTSTGVYDVSLFFRRLWHHRRWFSRAFVALMLPVVVIVGLWPSSFYASGTLIISNLEPAGSSQSAAIQKLGDPADLASQLLVAKSPRMIRLALERPGVFQAVTEECNYRPGITSILMLFSECAKLKLGSRELLEFVSSHYTVTAEGRSRIISIGYSSRLPEVSFALANALLFTYLEDQRGENAHARETAVSWLLKEQEPNGKSQLIPSFYRDLYRQATELEAERRDLPNPARLVSLAELPVHPASPRRLFLLAAGFIITVVSASFFAVLKDLRDGRIYLLDDIRALTSEPVYSPLPKAPGRKGNHLLTSKNDYSLLHAISNEWESPLLAKAARTLYAELALDTKGQSARCILVASATPDEGKTLATIALARAAAEMGRQVLVINCDLRNSVDQFSDVGSGGLASILRGEMEPQDTVVPTNISGLELIEAGAADTEPAMLFIDGHLPTLMSWARQYDLILLHGPSGFVPELRALASHAEGLLWCVRWGRTLLRNVRDDLQDLHRQRIKLLGVTLTMVDPGEMRHHQTPAGTMGAERGGGVGACKAGTPKQLALYEHRRSDRGGETHQGIPCE